MCKKQMKKQFRKFNWKKSLVLTAISIALILGVGLPIFAPKGIEAFIAWASIVVALVAIWVSMESLQLSRDTQRPFLTVVTTSPQPDEPAMRLNDNVFRITMQVKNTGNMPADAVSISCLLYTQNTGKDGERLEHAERYSPSIYFPQDTVAHTFLIKSERLAECQAAKSTIMIGMACKNKVAGRSCLTKRFFDYPQFGATPMSPANSTHDKDYWD